VSDKPSYNSHFWATERYYSEEQDNWIPVGWTTGETGYKFQGFIYCPQTTSVKEENLFVENDYPGNDERMKPNAQYIWEYFGSRGWTINAVAGLLGNLDRESGMSPCVWEAHIKGSTINEYGMHELNYEALQEFHDNPLKYHPWQPSVYRWPGYGIVQWTPYTNYYDWCHNLHGKYNGTGGVLPFWTLKSQLMRIEYELENGEQWGARPSLGYDLSFKEFTESTKTPSWLAKAFRYCYERPGSADTEAEERSERAEKWFNYLSTLAPISPETDTTVEEEASKVLKVSAFRKNRVDSTNAMLSFIKKNAETYSCKLFKGSEQQEDSMAVFEDLITNVCKISLYNLIPNTEYTVELEVQGKDDEKFSDKISFITKQSYPDSVKSITLTSNKSGLLADSSFTLKITKPDNLGYWKKSSGYDIMLLVNGQIKATKTDDVKSITANDYNIKDEFNYTIKTGDVIQVGVRVWTKDDKDNIIYNSYGVKTSEPICLSSKPVRAYLNID
jgi:hypothetical protein